MTRAQNGDSEAAGRVLTSHRGLIVNWCNEMVVAGIELDDMIQEAFIAGLSAIRWFRADRGWVFASYLKVCVRNHLARWRERQVMAGESGDLDEKAGDDDAPRPPIPFLDRLPATHRRILELRYGLGGGKPLAVGAVAMRLALTQDVVRRYEAQSVVILRALMGGGDAND